MSSPLRNRRLTDGELDLLREKLHRWDVRSEKLERTFHFSSFSEAIAFMVRVAFFADRLDHHPNWSNVYDRVHVTLWSHDLGGVSESCVTLATMMDEYGDLSRV